MKNDFLESFIFHPRKAYQQMGENDHLIEVEKGINVGARFHLNNPAASTILFFHGNGEIGPEYDDIAQVYNKKNINFIIVDFRGYGFSSGVPNVGNTQSDAHVILDYVLKHLKDQNYSGSLILMGRSLGSVSVLELAKRYPHDFPAFPGFVIKSSRRGCRGRPPVAFLSGLYPRRKTPCQKQPFTSTTVLYLGSTISGFPGRRLSCKTNLYPCL